MKGSFIERRPDAARRPGVLGRTRIGAVTIALLAATALQPCTAADPDGAPPPAPANGEMGFVLTVFSPAVVPGKQNCPDGFANSTEENYLSTLPVAEQARLQLKTNEAEFTQRWKASAVDDKGHNICGEPELFHHPDQKLVQSKIAYGLNLDGDTTGNATANTCAHENFASPTGERGIDNQLYRVAGCMRTWRGADYNGGEIVPGFNDFLKTGEHTMVMLLRHVDNLKNDNDVEVIFGTTDDPPVLDSKRDMLRNASFTLSHNPHWRNVLHGRIVDGVLTTDPADILLTDKIGLAGNRGQSLQWDFRMGRFKVALQPDGSMKGLFGAYEPFAEEISITQLGGIGSATIANMDCASEYAALKKYADGLPDPKTGKCTAISMAFNVEAIPAYVFDRPPVKTAEDSAR